MTINREFTLDVASVVLSSLLRRSEDFFTNSEGPVAEKTQEDDRTSLMEALRRLEANLQSLSHQHSELINEVKKSQASKEGSNIEVQDKKSLQTVVLVIFHQLDTFKQLLCELKQQAFHQRNSFHAELLHLMQELAQELLILAKNEGANDGRMVGKPSIPELHAVLECQKAQVDALQLENFGLKNKLMKSAYHNFELKSRLAKTAQMITQVLGTLAELNSKVNTDLVPGLDEKVAACLETCCDYLWGKGRTLINLGNTCCYRANVRLDRLSVLVKHVADGLRGHRDEHQLLLSKFNVLTKDRMELELRLKESSQVYEVKMKGLREENERRISAQIVENEEIIKTLSETHAARLTTRREEAEDRERRHLAEIGALRKQRLVEARDKDGEISRLLAEIKAKDELIAGLSAKERPKLPTDPHAADLMDRYDVISSPPTTKRSRAGSGCESSKSSPTYPIRIIFTGYRDVSGPQSLRHLSGLVEQLGGHVHIGDVFSENITHVVAPKDCNSVKVLAGSLTSKWIVSEEWLMASADAGMFLSESDFGGRRYVAERPFRNKTFLLAPGFATQQAQQQFDVSCCRTFIEKLGKGRVVLGSEEGAKIDYELVADKDACLDRVDGSTTSRLTIKDFLSLIPGSRGSLNP